MFLGCVISATYNQSGNPVFGTNYFFVTSLFYPSFETVEKRFSSHCEKKNDLSVLQSKKNNLYF